VEYQLATETPLGKTSKKKKTKRKPAAELEPLPVHYPLLIFISTLFSVWVLDIWRFDSSFQQAEFCLLAAIGVRAGSRTAREAKSHHDGLIATSSTRTIYGSAGFVQLKYCHIYIQL
jgi:hypothetical protein